MHNKHLYRSSEHRIIAGVCGGLAEYFETDPALVRIIFIILVFLGLGGLFLYLILWIMIPEKTSGEANGHMHEHHHEHHHRHSRGIFGLFVILIGILLLVNNLFPEYGFDRFWPVFVIFFGLILIARR